MVAVLYILSASALRYTRALWRVYVN